MLLQQKPAPESLCKFIKEDVYSWLLVYALFVI